MMKPKKIPYFYNKEPIEFIVKFEKGISGKLISRSSYINGLENVDLKLKNERDEFELDFKTIIKKTKKPINWRDKTFNHVTFQTLKFDIIFDKLYSWDWFTGFSNAFHSKGFNDSKKYFKFIIPLKRKINFHFQLEEFLFSSDYSKWSRVATSISCDDENIYALQEGVKVKDKKKDYLIIESDKKQLYSEFADKVFAFRVALGYIIGDFRGGRAYMFSYNNKKRDRFDGFSFRTLRKDMKSLYQPINSNPYAWLHSRGRKQAKKIYKERNLRTLNKLEFSTLVELTLKNDNFLGTLLTMIEAGNLSLLISPAIYFIVLEQFSNIIVKEKPIIPISDANDAEYLKNEILGIVKKFEEEKIQKNYLLNPIIKRIENINQETNNDKLISCFKKLNIELSKEDLKIIKARNRLLHGNIPNYRKKRNRTIRDKDSDLYYTSIRIYTLLNMLILKYIGYNNYVINFSKIYEQNTGYSVDEEFYRKV
ncbi:MAG: hypothetical protein CMP05_05400 [Xanthomarina sp.]|uniref:hypothetical protein n=1 Tax=Xanthomarina sp. TaxID=1931211 RepID=UPI000C540F6A|nr:hypothetical protein [Xanthomarina sp.]MAL24110.1 hypothetical protein [Xanthomarina sp.]MBF61419.1 hypothetical protein [Xanthomarina sp.]